MNPFKIFIVCVALSTSAFAVPADVTTCFSPRQHCAAALIDALNKAEKKIYVHAYSFTHPDIAAALVAAKKRGVDVQVHMDKNRIAEKYSVFPLFVENAFAISIQDKPPIAHNKIMIVDEDLVITGSFNWTKNAAKNEENLNFIHSKELAKVYLENWERVTEVKNAQTKLN